MEKSEVSDTDAPAIRQAIHGSAFRVLLFARGGESQPGRAWEIYAGSNIRLPANNRAYATHVAFLASSVLRDPSRASSGQAEPKYSAHCTRNVGRHTRRSRKSPLWWNGVKELNRPFKVTNQLAPTLPFSHPPCQANEFGRAHTLHRARFDRWRRAKSTPRIYNRVISPRSWIISYGY